MHAVKIFVLVNFLFFLIEVLIDLVFKFVNGLVSQGFIDSVFGIVDNDGKNSQPKQNIFYGERYALENYIYDPINIHLYLESINGLDENAPVFRRNGLESTKNSFQKIVNFYSQFIPSDSHQEEIL